MMRFTALSTRIPARAGRLLAAFAALATLSGCIFGGGSAPTTFDLTAPRGTGRIGALRGQIVVAEPVTTQALEAEQILIKEPSGAISFLPGGQWADRLPRLIQARLIQTFENSSQLSAISRPGDRVSADYQLNTEIRAFQVQADTGEALVEISVKLVGDRSGRIATARVFSARVPVDKVDAAVVAQGLDQALSRVLVDIVRWIGGGGRR